MAALKLTIFLIFVAVHFPNVRSFNIIGMGIELRNYNILGPVLQSGAQIFAQLPKQCMKSGAVYQTRHTFSYYKDTSSFYKQVGTTAGVDASLQSDYTMGFTLDSVTNSVSGESRTVSGDALQVMASAWQDVLQLSCLYNQPLDPRLLDDLARLPTTIDSPSKSSSWQAYDVFLTKYGSHLVSAITYGSSIVQTSFAETSYSYSERDFEVMSCLNLMGPTEAGMANLSLCGGVSQEEINQVSKYAMNSNLVVNGGTTATRNQLLDDDNRTNELIIKFMNEANVTRSPIFYSFKPIWEIIQGHGNSSDDDLIRGVNMEQYYQGYLSYGCTLLQASDMNLQQFDLSPQSSPGAPRYECTLAQEGCHHDADCHYRLVKCKCEDNTCVRYFNAEQNTGDYKTVPAINHADKWYWNGCGWKVAGSKCECKSTGDVRYVAWSGDNKADVGLNHNNPTRSKKASKKKEEL